MWWKLPPEIIEQILIHVSFPDYVALTQVSRELRSTLDSETYFLVVLESNYGNAIEAYNWPIDPDISRVNLWKAFVELELFLASLHMLYNKKATESETSDLSHNTSKVNYPRDGPLNSWSEFVLIAQSSAGANYDHWRHVLMEVGLNTFAVKSMYFFPLISEFEKRKMEFQGKCEEAGSSKTIPIQRLSWTRKLLQLQNFGQSVRFFNETDCQDTTDIERCYFELSRCYDDFDSSVWYRSSKLNQMKAALQAKLPITEGGLQFLTWEAYLRFLEDLITTLLPYLGSNSSVGSGGNILRIYEGCGKESQSLHLAIVAKVLRDVFNKLHFKVAGSTNMKMHVSLSSLFLIIGSTYISVDFELNSLSFYGENDLHRLPISSMEQAKTSMNSSDVLRRAFEAERATDLISNFHDIDWKSYHVTTNEEKLRFLRTILIPISENQELESHRYSPLIHEGDFFSYFSCAQAQIGQKVPQKPVTTTQVMNRKPVPWHDSNLNEGAIVFNVNSQYIGTALGVYDVFPASGTYTEVLPSDSIKKTMSSEKSLRPLETHMLSDRFVPFIIWLMSTEGFTYAGMFLFPSLSIEGTEICFSNCKQRHT